MLTAKSLFQEIIDDDESFRLFCSIAASGDLVVDALRAIGVDVESPKGTIYVWAPVPEGDTSVSFCEHVLAEAAVVISPGSMYGPSGEGVFRISLTTPDERITEAVERMRDHLS